ncbi:T9SS type A sorting domain-containing protein [Pontibacter burrus]|uniref:T9SS type A sorting domain-containing protein n=1 Tax=Pontibacter burrus TaxID=2704466 RepID=A0A6B3LRY6_9BACT|nr:T9SS type A sorting domain-containing protein [Pontibacter burrus]NEM96261.1 T9SS type A sorting domain-containing protein [Pontibacter burrus]
MNATTVRVLLIKKIVLILFAWAGLNYSAQAQTTTTTTWLGQTDSWSTGTNWSGGVVPTASTNVIIPVVSAPRKAPVININGIAECLSLTIQPGASLEVSNDKGMTIHGDVTIGAGATFTNDGSAIEVKGSWVNNGVYVETIFVRGQSINARSNQNPRITFSGADKTMGGTSASTFSNILISGSITLTNNIATTGLEKNKVTADPQLQLTGSLDPQLNRVTLATGPALQPFVIGAGATAFVKASTYYANYSIVPSAMATTSVIDYAASGNQTITKDITYPILRVSGSGIKALQDNTNLLATTTDVQVQVVGGTLDVGNFTLNRSTADGRIRIATGATLRIGGNKPFPAAYPTRTFEPNSTVEYYGAAQAVTPLTAPDYWHLVISGSGSKIMPATPMLIQGNLTSTQRAVVNASAAITVNGNLITATESAFTGNTLGHTIKGDVLNNGTFTHGNGTITISGNWINNGVFNHAGGTIKFDGSANTTITGTTTFNTLAIEKAALTNYVSLNHTVTAANLNLASGDLHTGINKIILTNNRSGNGWVVGTLTRQHNFVSGVGYAFNGSFATLTFSGAAGVSEATMKTGQAGFVPSGFTTGKSINRMYEVQVPAGTFTNASLQLQYQDAELNNCEESGLKLYFSPTGTSTWSNASRHDYNDTQNWVRRNGLTSLNGFWTLTDNPSTYKWDGSADINWENGANWEVFTDGPPTRGVAGPMSSDFVELGSLKAIRQPTISTDVWVRDVRFFGTDQITLTMAAGSLRTTGNLATIGAGSNVQHALYGNAQNITIGGDLILNDGSTGNNLSLNTTTGNVIIAGNIAHRATSNINLGSGSLAIAGNYNYEAGSFTGGTSTVTYNGTSSQLVAAVPYHHLAINKAAGTANYTATIPQGISGNLSVVNAGTLNLNMPTLTIGGGVNLTAGALHANASTIDLKGNWTTANLTSFVPGSSTVIFSGSANQRVSATNFHHLQKTTANTLTTTGNSTIGGNLTLLSGIMVLDGHTLNHGGTNGALALADNATLRVQGAAAFPANFANYSLGQQSTAIYSATGAGIAGVTYGNLSLQNGSTGALLGDTRVANQMQLASGAVLNDAPATLTLNRDLQNSGTINAPNTNLVFTSASAQLGTFPGAGSATIRNATIEAGASLNVSQSLTLYGNLTNNGNSFSALATQVVFAGADNATIVSGFPIVIDQLRIAKAAPTATVTLQSPVINMQRVDVLSGTLDAANQTLTERFGVVSSLTIADGATMRVGGANSFPAFDNYSLAANSYAVYNGNNQQVKSIQYGHLHLLNTATATFENGIVKVAGNMLKGNEATVVTPHTVEFNGSTDQSVPGINYKNLVFSAAGNKNLTGNALVAEKLSLTAGMVRTHAYELELGPTATMEGEREDSFVLGTLKTTRTVPAGVRSDFGGMGIAVTPALEAGAATMRRVTGTSVGQDNNSIRRYYHFVPEVNVGKLNATIEAAYLTADLNGHEEAALQLFTARFLADGWTAISEIGNTRTGKTITATGVNSFNFLTFGTSVMPLPVELVYFKAVKEGRNAMLQWKTASEKDNAGFEVQVSTDGKNYLKIGFVESTVGTSAVAQHYSFTDARNGKNGVLYYRIKQLDTDGTATLFGPAAVNFGNVTATTVAAYPNPFEKNIQLAINAEQDGKATIALYTVGGQVILKQDQQLLKGASVLEVPLNENLQRGMYLLTVAFGNQTQTLKLIKR